jgi:hypothetical protein
MEQETKVLPCMVCGMPNRRTVMNDEIGGNRYVAFGIPVSLTGARQVGAVVQLRLRARSQRGLD